MKGCLALPKGWGGQGRFLESLVVFSALGWLIVRCLWRLFCFLLLPFFFGSCIAEISPCIMKEVIISKNERLIYSIPSILLQGLFLYVFRGVGVKFVKIISFRSVRFEDW